MYDFIVIFLPNNIYTVCINLQTQTVVFCINRFLIIRGLPVLLNIIKELRPNLYFFVSDLYRLYKSVYLYILALKRSNDCSL